MLKIYIPKIYAQSVYTINYQKLKDNNIKCLLFDLDNTLVPTNIKTPTKEVKQLFNKLDALGFKVIILSNATKRRLSNFKEILNVDTSALSCKPYSFKYKKIMQIYKFKKEQIAAIGDQLCTDIKGANKVGIMSILINPLSKKERINTKINRLKEKIIYKYFEDNNILRKGEYYE